MQSYRESVKKDETRIWIDENNLKASIKRELHYLILKSLIVFAFIH